AFAVGVPAVLLWTVYVQGPALWPDSWMSPFVLGGALALERFERTGRVRPLTLGGLLLGLAVIVKQTSAWVSLAALVWLGLGSRRRSPRHAVRMTLAIA